MDACAEDGRTARYGALFLHLDTEPRIDPLRPWVDAADLESVQSDDRGRTRVPRLYVAGDLGRNMHQAAMAAASGGHGGHGHQLRPDPGGPPRLAARPAAPGTRTLTGAPQGQDSRPPRTDRSTPPR